MNVDTLGRPNLRQVSQLHRQTLRGWSPNRRSWIRSPTVIVAVVTAAVTLVLRLAYGASKPTDLDGLRDVLGSEHFNVNRLSPAAPGSWLYVAAGHALHVVSGLSPVHSLVLLAALLSAAAAGLTAVAGTVLGGRFVGLAAGVLVASAPVSWFAGSTVSTYSVDALVAALLVVLARRARPGGAHGAVALVVLGLGAGVRLSVIPAFALLAVVALVASVRTVGHLLSAAAAGIAAVAVWLVPVMVVQPGGISAWLHATHVQISDAARTGSVFAAPRTGVVTNLGRFGGWSVVSLGPVFIVAVAAVIVLAGARLTTGQPGGNASLRIWQTTDEPRAAVERPRYQSSAAILSLALLPPLALVTLGRFSSGGAVLSYLVPATVLLLLPLGRLLHHRSSRLRRTAVVVGSLLVALLVAVNVQRFVSAPGILPTSVIRHEPGLWISQSRYQSPYAETAATIRAADERHRPPGP